MCDLGVNIENFNPRVLYTFKRKFGSSDKIEYHSHDFTSIFYVLGGSCTYNINNTLYQVKKGDLIVCNPGVFHNKVFSPGDEITELHIGINNVCIRNLPKDCLIDNNISPILALGKYEYDYVRACNEIMSEQERGEPGCDLILKAIVMKLIVLILKASCQESKHDRDMSKDSGSVGLEAYDKVSIVNSIVSFINENYMKEVSLEKISRNMYLSPVYISKIFKDETGDSPINFLIKTRLMKAKELLEEGRMPIKAAAKNVGYHDAYHFSKLFKKYYGYPPSGVGKQ